jgi:Holliday junction resolvase RusA-like endonuclease
LSWPPSANHATKHPAQGVHYLTERHRSYRQEVVQEVYQRRIQRQPIRGRYWAEVNFHAPDRRRRDADNLTKVIFDALVKAGAIADDCNMRQLILHWHEWTLGQRGRVVLHVFEI